MTLNANPSPDSKPTRKIRVGFALSGGGFRAAAFHLGVLKRTEELGLLQRVEALSTVSGGSITGALYALRCAEQGGEPGSYPVDALIAEMRPFLSSNLRSKALFGTPWRTIQAVTSVVSKRVSRIGLMVNELDRQLFGNKRLNQMPSWIAINATNLRTGKGWRFMCDRAGDGLVGATEHTESIRVSEAVGASAAYPGLMDSYAFSTRWEHMRGDLLSENLWERPPAKKPGYVSAWRERYGQPSGAVHFPLVDGGLYDNEGVNTLRSHKVTHVVISSVSPPVSDTASGFTLRRLLRIVDVVHDRLGAATRQLAHEMTHSVHPSVAADKLRALAESISLVTTNHNLPDQVRTTLIKAAEEAQVLAEIGMPPRGHQFAASAQVLLHRTDIAENAFADQQRGGYGIPANYRGLDSSLVAELSRVRTDLDALEPSVVELLIAQGYFVTDFHLKLTMPDLIFDGRASRTWYDEYNAPSWEAAHATVQEANANRAAVLAQLLVAGKRQSIFGNVSNARERWIYRANFGMIAIPLVALFTLPALWLLIGLVKILGFLTGYSLRGR